MLEQETFNGLTSRSSRVYCGGLKYRRCHESLIGELSVHASSCFKKTSKLVIVSALLWILPVYGDAQSTPNIDYLRKYLFIAPTSDRSDKTNNSAYAVGGGGEQLLGKGFGAG